MTLIPKFEVLKSVKDFRSIACCNVCYKVVSKFLIARLEKVIGKVVSTAQSGFIPGKLIADNILLATEIVRCYERKHNCPKCMVKVDLRKAYDSSEWNVIETMMVELGFPKQYVEWVMKCITLVSYTMLVKLTMLMAILSNHSM